MFFSSKVKSLSCVRLFVTPWTVAYQAPLSMGFSRQENWGGLPFPSPGDLPNPGIESGIQHCRQTLYRLSHQGSLFKLCIAVRVGLQRKLNAEKFMLLNVVLEKTLESLGLQ